MPKKNQALSDKHWEALRLIEEGNLSLKQIAAQVGWSAQHMYSLQEGKENAGFIGQLFKAELSKIEKKQSSKIKELTKSNISKCLRIMDDVLTLKASLPTVTDEDAKLVVSIHNSLAKSTPNVEIGSLQYNYTKGLTSEELVHEFNKLKSLAIGAPKRRGVSEAGSGSTRVLSASSE